MKRCIKDKLVLFLRTSYENKFGEVDNIMKGETKLNLNVKSTENVEYMIDQIKEKLKVLNFGAIKATHFDGEMYEELKEIYEHVMKKDSFSPNEMQAIAEELGNLRKQ